MHKAFKHSCAHSSLAFPTTPCPLESYKFWFRTVLGLGSLGPLGPIYSICLICRPNYPIFFHRHDRAMRQWDGPKRLRDRLGSILGSLRALRGTPDADRDASNWSPNLVLGVSQGPDRSSSLSSVTRPLIFGAGRRARAGSERCFGNKTFGPAQKIFRTQNQNQT